MIYKTFQKIIFLKVKKLITKFYYNKKIEIEKNEKLVL